MKKIILGLVAATAVVAPLTFAGTAQAYTPPTHPDTSTVAHPDMRVQLDSGNPYYHEFDLDYATPVAGVIPFTGFGKQFDNDGETIIGDINLTTHTLSYTADYLTNGAKNGKTWTVSNAPLDGTSGLADWHGESLTVNGSVLNMSLLGDILIPEVTPATGTGSEGTGSTGGSEGTGSTGTGSDVPPATAPAAGNHGQCVSGASHVGIKGKALSVIAGDSTKFGAFGSATCKV